MVFDAPAATPSEPAAAALAQGLDVRRHPEPKVRRALRRCSSGPAIAAIGLVLFLIGALGVGAWLMQPKTPTVAAAHPVVVVPGAVPETGLRQFETALGAVDCSWLQLEKIAPGPGGVDVAVSGVAASPPAVQSALMAAAASAKVQVADIDLTSIAPPPPGLCSTLDALRTYRAPTSISGQNLTAAQDSFAVMKQADGKEAGRAIVTATPPPQGDFAVLELGADDSLGLVTADRQGFQTLAAAGVVVSKVAGRWRLPARTGRLRQARLVEPDPADRARPLPASPC